MVAGATKWTVELTREQWEEIERRGERVEAQPFRPAAPYVRHDAGAGPTESWDPVVG